jgi:hypothetical protein
MDNPLKSLTLPILGDSNFEPWRQSLLLIASAMSAVDTDPTKLKDDAKRSFYALASIMLNSLSEHPRAIAIGSGSPMDIVPYRMFDRLKKFYTPIATFNDLAYRHKFFLL